GGGGAEDGPEHPVDGFGVGIPRGVSLGHLGVGKLHHHDGTVDQDPQPQQEPEDHHEVVGEAQHGDDDEGEQEGEGYRQGHQHARAYADGGDDHNQYQDHRGDHVALQAHVLLDDHRRRVVHIADLHGWGQRGQHIGDDDIDLVHGLDQIGALAYLHVD